MLEELRKNGMYVLRGALTEDEVDRLANPIRTAFATANYDSYKAESAYPKPGIYSVGPRVLDDHPEIAEVSLAHPAILGAIEAFFGEPVSLGQYWSIMRPPGAGVGDAPFVDGSTAHYDYKPWRCVGSYVRWMFAVIPFVDYTESAGPLVIAPGSYTKTSVLPSDGRVHQVDAARVPAADTIELLDPQLRKGDVALMHGFSWHEARPNYGDTDRCGLYMKFYARSSPPACGPTVYPSAVHEFLPDEKKYLIPQHRADGRYAAVREAGPIGGVDEGQLLIEDSEGHILVLGNNSEGWQLPRFEAEEDDTAGILDVCNVMGSVQKRASEQLGLMLPWLSWLQDICGPGRNGASETRCRVYGHRLTNAKPPVNTDTTSYRWMSSAELAAAESDALLDCGTQVLKWLHMWQQEEDADGNTVVRSYGVPTTYVQYYSYNGNGNPPGCYRVGVFDDDGLPRPDDAAA
jgi:hypothetical protein